MAYLKYKVCYRVGISRCFVVRIAIGQQSTEPNRSPSSEKYAKGQPCILDRCAVARKP